MTEQVIKEAERAGIYKAMRLQQGRRAATRDRKHKIVSRNAREATLPRRRPASRQGWMQ